MRLLFASTPVGPLGGGSGGGVETTVALMAQVLQRQGHEVEVLAPHGSQLDDVSLIEVSGYHQVSQLVNRRQSVSMPYSGTLAKTWDGIRQRELRFDCIVNFAYDWLPFYLAAFLKRPVKHLVSMAALHDGMRERVRLTALVSKDAVAMHTRAQADTFGLADSCRIVGYGLDVDRYTWNPSPGDAFAWVGRISEEKGLEDAVSASARAGCRLRVFGKMENRSYWESALASAPGARVEYVGFLSTDMLQQEVGRCRGLLATSKCVEALGISFLEGLATGVPVVAYARGAPAEYVHQGINGFLVPPDDVGKLASAMGQVDRIDRRACRKSVEEMFSLQQFGRAIEQWLLA